MDAKIELGLTLALIFENAKLTKSRNRWRLLAVLLWLLCVWQVSHANASEDDGRDCVALAVYAEARSEPWAGQEMVAAVIRNRAGYLGDLCTVVQAPGQFVGVELWQYPRQPGEAAAWATAREVTELVLLDQAELPEDCLHALNFHTLPIRNADRVACVIGSHVFTY